MEVQASGILRPSPRMPDPGRHPRVRDLSARQAEVLRRLLHGDRVPKIASDLFLSPSTVRNHLAAIFRAFGVHSQPDLLALFAADDAMAAGGP
jgi:DNA-binding NarL/FixJ family response regulator